MSGKRVSTKPKYVELTLDILRDRFQSGEKVIEYCYANGDDPNKMTKKELEKRKYYFIPNGTLLIRKMDKTMTKKTNKRVEHFLDRNNNHMIDYSKKKGIIFYFLEGHHKFYENEGFFPSLVQICQGNIISDNCIGGENWIRNN
jgi:hypothetical protein